jgi:hypothetical protein
MNIDIFKNKLDDVQPIHDTPIGVIHPYWARKPMNIIDELIIAFSEQGDIVLDPFMGSGTVIFSAIKNKRKAIGTDINPLSILIVEELINLSNSPASTEKLLNEFTAKAQEMLLPLFEVSESRYIERERFEVNGEFENGNFTLNKIETVSKKYHNGKWFGRKIEDLSLHVSPLAKWDNYLNHPISFSTIPLLKNSRIAIPEGATLADFYTEKNRICINFILELIEQSEYTIDQKQACKFLLSSSLPLLRLSDKKASSQWPYWRPKNFLTSRNPIIVLHDRLKKIIKGTEWLKEVGIYGKSCNNTDDIDINAPFIAEIAIQNLSGHINLKPKLILTDPPYSDHVPYLEYSAIWNEILGFKIGESHYANEIVNTDAPARKKDTLDYQSRLSSALKVCAELIHPEGVIIWFYQDQELKNWERIYDEAKINELYILDVISLPKQRRSMKSVTSPNKTLDGDLIIIFSKNDYLEKYPIIENVIKENRAYNYYDKYVSIIKGALINGTVNHLTKDYKNINELINSER